MLNFKPISLESLDEIKEYLPCKSNRTCDSTVGTLFMWREFYKSEYTIYNETLFMKVKILDEKTSFTLPIGKRPLEEGLQTLVEYTDQMNIPLIFCAIPEEAVEPIKNFFQNNVEFQFDRDMSDYLYLSEDLSQLKGRRYSGQRNHMNKFRKMYPDYQYIRMNKDNIGRVMEFYDGFSKNMVKAMETAIEENKRTEEILPLIGDIGLFGGFIEVDGEIIALSVGEIINDTLYVHIEKALKEYPGSYQMIMNEFAKDSVNETVLYINREDDAGDLGLRTSKLSYHPHQLLDKYYIKVIK